MKQKILIEIEYPDCDTLNINQDDLMSIQNEALNQLGIVENVAEGRFNINAKLVKPIAEDKLDELAKKYENNMSIEDCYNPLSVIVKNAFKTGYHKSMEE